MRCFAKTALISLTIMVLLFGAEFAAAVVAMDGNKIYEVPLPAGDSRDHPSSDREFVMDSARLDAGAAFGGSWRAHTWNPQSKTARYVYGSGSRASSPIAGRQDLEREARRVIGDCPELFQADPAELTLSDSPHALGRWVAHFQQHYRGLEVWQGGVQVAFADDGRLLLMSSDFYGGIDLDTRPGIDRSSAELFCRLDLPFDPDTDRVEEGSELLILPYPDSPGSVSYHLVWRVRVHTADPLGIWVTHIDAHSGEILWRYNDIHFYFGGSASSLPQHFSYCDGRVAQASPYLEIDMTYSGNDLGIVTTDADGHWFEPADDFYFTSLNCWLKGPYVHIRENYDGGVAHIQDWLYNDTPYKVHFDDGNSTQDERTVFDAVNDIHDFFQTFAPEFEYAHQQIKALVSIENYCNAYFNGELNFFIEGDGCANTGEMQQVVHHEYGHGVQKAILGWQGDQGLGEGNSDILANLMTGESIIARGFWLDNCSTGIRNSDNTRRYPEDVYDHSIHYAGTVIAGFNWDALTRLQEIHGKEEGTLAAARPWHYGRVLLLPTRQTDQVFATFFADDDDGDISNGTPHHEIYCEAAAEHGFDCPEILEGVFISHSPLGDTVDGGLARQVSAQVLATSAPVDPDQTRLAWRWNGGVWNEVPLSQIAGDEYGAEVPAQTLGRVDYYLRAADDNGTASILPPGAPGETFSYLVASQLDEMESPGEWTVGAAGDEASSGIWVRVDPVGTSAQPEEDHTIAGTLCWVTGQHEGGSDGANDVDGGRTTLISPVYELSGCTAALLHYWWWFSNSEGSDPGSDFWRVDISNDGGETWSPLEASATSTNAWRDRFVDILEIFPSPDRLRLRFSAEDFDISSLVEAGLDDLSIMAIMSASGVDEELEITLTGGLEQNRPNPFNPSTEIRFRLASDSRASLAIYDVNGRLVRTLLDRELSAGEQVLSWNGDDAQGNPVSAGVYFYRLVTESRSFSRRMVLIK